MKTIADLFNDLKETETNLLKLKDNLFEFEGQVALRYIQGNFKSQGYDHLTNSWQKRDSKTDYAYDNYSRYKGTVYSSNNPILKQTGDLFNSIQYFPNKMTGYVDIGIREDSPTYEYARANNEGVEGKLPQRKFIGWTPALKKAVRNSILERYNRALKKLE
jgi:phage gpG-like protein